MENICKFELDISDEDLNMLNDLIRMITIQFITHILISLTNNGIGFLNLQFWKVTFYILLSIAFYWFIVKKYIILEKKSII
jgi:hypothetical protein